MKKSIQKILFFLLFFLFTGVFQQAFADGSVNLYPNGAQGNRAYMYATTSTNEHPSFPFKTLGTHYVYVQDQEYITVASSAQGIGSGAIRMTSPTGIVTTTTAGRIADRTRELAGPLAPSQGAGGNRYAPFSFRVAANQGGVWKIEFSASTDPATTTDPGTAPDIKANADWSPQSNASLFIAAWDISVRNTANSSWIPGRVYANVLNLSISGQFADATKSYYGTNYVLTKDGRAYFVQNNGNNGFGFTFFSNNKGFIDASGNATFMSLNFSDNTRVKNAVQDPRIEDNAALNLVTHKLFYTAPAADLPQSAPVAISGNTPTTTWLKNEAIVPTITNVSFTGSEGTPAQASQKGGYINFTANVSGSYRIVIPVAGGSDRVLTGSADAGANQVVWDGKDGAGVTVPPNELIPVVKVRLTSAEVHFPFIDMEINPNGIIIELTVNNTTYGVNRASTDESVYSDRVYWDDSQITGGNGRVSNPTVNTVDGISSRTNGHEWGDYNGQGGSSFGNEKSLDTYAYILSNEAAIPLNVKIKVADLQIESIASNIQTVSVGGNVTFTVKVKNSTGSSDIVGSKFNFDVPSGFVIKTVTSSSSCANESGANNSGANYQSTLDLPGGCEIVYTITGTVDATLKGQAIPVTASILRPNDVTDPDATNTVFEQRPASAQVECDAAKVVTGTNCNNILTNAQASVANPLGTVTGGRIVCEGTAPVVITFTGSNSSPAYTFYYTINGAPQTPKLSGPAGTATVNQPTTPGTYVYNLVAVSDGNSDYQNPQSGATATTTVTVNPLSTASISAGTAVCQNSAAVPVTFTGTGGTAPYTFTYTINGGAAQQVPSDASGHLVLSQVTNVPGDFQYVITSISDQNGCPNVQSASSTIRINPLPTASLSGSTSTCQNGEVQVTLTGIGGTIPYTFTYTVNGGAEQQAVSDDLGEFVLFQDTSVPGDFKYVITSVSDQNNCPNVQSVSSTVTVKPLSIASVSASTSVCQNSAAVPVIFTGTGGVAPYRFTYTINGGSAQQGVSNTSGQFTLTQGTGVPGNFKYVITGISDKNGCPHSQLVTSTVTVNPLPTASISGTATVCAGSTASVTFTGTGGTAPYTFTYKVDGVTKTVVSTGNVAIVQQPAVAGVYTYELLSVSDGSSTACNNAQTGTAVITVNPLPTATITGTNTVCAGATPSVITFTGAGGTAPYTFTYTVNGVTKTIVSTGNVATVDQPAVAGVYTYELLNVFDASSTACSNPQTGTVVITVNPLPTATITGTNTVCASATPSVITFTGAAGTAPYTFTYKVDGVTKTIVSTGNVATVNQPAVIGVYTYELLNVSDGSSTACDNAQTGTVVITVNPLPTATITGTNTVCASATPSVITFTGAGGTAPYTFTYTVDGVTKTIVSTGNVATVDQPSVAGVYTYELLNVSDASSTACDNAQTGTVIITVNPLPTATITGTNTVCASATPSVITFTGAGGTAPYTFTYKVDGVTKTIVSTGNVATVNQPAVAGIYTYELLNVSDGSSTACDNAQTGTVVITVNPLPTATITGTNTVCASATPSIITFTGSGGNAPYAFTYTVDGVTKTVVSTGNVATVEQPAVAGIYTYELLNVSGTSSTACDNAQTGTVVITVNPLPTATITGTNTVCASATPSVITFTGAGGTAPYTFTYTVDGVTKTVVSTGNVATVDQPAVAGVYTYELLNVSDGSSTACDNAQTGTVIITVNPLPTATITGTNTVCASATPSVITFTGAGGTAPYTFTYTVDGVTKTVVSTGNVATVGQPAIPGVYTYELLNVSDGSSTACDNAQTGTVIITVNPLPTATITGTNTVCASATPSVITFTGAGGTAPYTFTYTVDGVTKTIVSTGNVVTVDQPAVAGVYTYELLNVSDASSTACDNAQTGTVVITVNPLPTATITGTNTVCASATPSVITFTGSGGTAPYTFTYTVDGVTKTVVSTGNVATVNQPAVAGIYTYELLNVSDGSSTACDNAQTGTVVITVNPLPTATITGTNTVCASATPSVITFTGAGGTAPYTFTYKVGGVTKTIVSTGNVATVDQPAVAGVYTYELLNVSDGSSTACDNAQTGTAIITVNPLPTATITGTNTVCASATPSVITFTGAGDTAPYTFTYKVDGVTKTVVSTGNVATVDQPAIPGVYTYELLNVSDGSSTACDNAQTGTVIITVNPLPTATITGTNTVCASATPSVITFTGAGGTAPYTFTYKVDGVTKTIVSTGNVSTVNQPAVAGVYTYELLNVSDGSSTACDNAQTGTVVITVNPLPTATITGTNTVCASATPSVITFTGAGGTAPYTFTYTVDGVTKTIVSTGNVATVDQPAVAGVYTYELLNVSDGSSTACDNAQTGTVIITVNPLPTATITGTNTVCASATPSVITFTGAGGTAPYTFTYKIGNITRTVVSTGNVATVDQPAVAGVYTYQLLNVSDGSSTACDNAQTGTVIITVNPLPTATITGTNTVCASATPSVITFTGAGGTAPYTFTYKIGNTIRTVISTGNVATVDQPAVAGVYTYELLNVSDGSSTACDNAQTGTVIITVNPLPTAIITGTNTVCASATPSVITFTGAGGTAPYTFIYKVDGVTKTVVSTGNVATVDQPAVAGIYTYELMNVSDGSSTACDNAQTGTVIITVNPLPTATITGTNTVCASATPSVITFTGAGGTAPYTFTYKIGNTIRTVISTGNVATVDQPAVAGVYTYELLNVSDASSTACDNAQTGTVVITVNPLPTATITGTNTVCANATPSVITFTGFGGTAPYTFTYKIGNSTRTVVSTGNVATVDQPAVAGVYTYELLKVSDASSTACGNAQTGTVVITVNPLPTATITGTNTVCANAAPSVITFTGSGGTAPYTFTYKIGNITRTVISTGNVATVEQPAVTGVYTYELLNVSDGSSTACDNAQTGTITITVNPRPAGYDDIISNLSCGNTTISYNLQDNINNTAEGGNAVPSTFTWTAVPNSNVTGISSGSGNAINTTLYNLSHSVQQVIYTITPTSTLGGCPGQTFTVTVNVPVCSEITITKTADVSVVSRAGDQIRYTITVKNTATANHTGVKVTDPFLGGVLTGPTSGDNGNGILEANESWVYTGTYRVTQADIDNNGKPNAGTGKIINTATVNTVEHPDPLAASSSVDIVTTGDITLVKMGTISSDFSTVTYTFTVTNTGRVRLHNLNLMDPKMGGRINLNPDVLDAGASVSTTVVYTVTDAEKRDGRVSNTATVTGITPAGDVVTDISGTQGNNDNPTVNIIDDAPQAINDNASTMINQPVTFSLTDNDLPSFNGLDKGSIIIVKFPVNGTVQVNPDGTITYTPNRGYSGPESFTYTITDLKGKISNKALVSITVIPIDLFIPNVFTPNGDGKNDTFRIIGRESFDSIDLLVFNRWGNEVYRRNNYLDDWDGSGLNEGTYYYLITLKKGGNEIVKKGWILLKR